MILITDISKSRRDSAQEMLYYMGLLSYSVSPENAARELCSAPYSALLITSVSGFDAERLTLYARGRGITVGAVATEESSAYDVVFPEGSYAADIACGMRDAAVVRGLREIGKYSFGDVDASQAAGVVRRCGKIVELTRTETMILRYLIKKHPEHTTAEDILKYAFRPSRTPEVSSVRTHLSVMNKKFREMTGRMLTEPPTGAGYRLAEEKSPLLAVAE